MTIFQRSSLSSNILAIRLNLTHTLLYSAISSLLVFHFMATLSSLARSPIKFYYIQIMYKEIHINGHSTCCSDLILSFIPKVDRPSSHLSYKTQDHMIQVVNIPTTYVSVRFVPSIDELYLRYLEQSLLLHEDGQLSLHSLTYHQ